MTPLGVAALHGNLEAVSVLLEVGASQDKPLTENGNTRHLNIIRFLTETGLDKDQRTAEPRWTPLHVAAQAGHLDVVRILVEAGARKDRTSKTGITPLFAAAHKGQIEIVRWLVACGAAKD